MESPHNELTRNVIAAAIEVHRVLGPGLLESVYLECLRLELTNRNLRFAAQVAIPIAYKGLDLGVGYRVDLLVEDRLVVEVKSVERVIAVHKAQVLTYLRLTACPLGLLINFNVAKLVDGVRRLVNPRALGRHEAFDSAQA